MQVTFLAAGLADVAGEDPGLFMMMMLMLLGCVTALAVSLFLAAIFVGFIAIFMGTGVLSVAAIVGFRQRSVGAGFKWLLRLSFQLLAIIGFTGVFYLLIDLAFICSLYAGIRNRHYCGLVGRASF